MPEDQAQVLASTAENHVDGVAFSALEEVAMQQTVAFHVTDDRFDGIASLQLSSNAAGHAALLSRFEDANIGDIVTAVTQVDVITLREVVPVVKTGL